MATYKLMQDIEAEDHILGPLTLRQFIYALVAAFLYYISFVLLTSGGAFMVAFTVPPALLLSFFAFPFGKDQPTEVWALAKIRFLFKPRTRLWDQSGIKELVTITVPKKIEPVLTDGLSQTEVKSRLNALANTLDSRGWVVKNVNVNAFANPNPFAPQNSDRLIDLNSLPQEVPSYDVAASDDILDTASNPVAQQFDHMITQSEQTHHQKLIAQMNNPQPAVSASPAPAAPSDYWFTNHAGRTAAATAPFDGQAASAGDSSGQDDVSLASQLKAKHDQQGVSNAHLRTLQPVTVDASKLPPEPIAAPVTPPTDPAILSLASNNDLNVATLAREAKKAKHDDQAPQDEVVISLR